MEAKKLFFKFPDLIEYRGGNTLDTMLQQSYKSFEHISFVNVL